MTAILPPGVAPIKAEYLVDTNVTAPAPAPTPTEGTTPAEDTRNQASEPPFKKRKKIRGQNKGRKSTHVRDEVDICRRFATGETCAEPCKFSHDLAAYMAVKPADIGERCVNFDRTGRCQYGHRCRFAKAHTDAEGKLVEDAEKMAMAGPAHLNHVNGDFFKKMRKGEIPFTKSKEVIALLEKQKFIAPNKAAEPIVADPAMVEVVVGEATEAEAEVKVGGNAKDNAGTKTEPKLAERKSESTDGGLDVPLRLCEKRTIDFRGKTYLAPLTTVGNLPYRRICKGFGVDITCGEMALSHNLMAGHKSEWSLIKRHPSEDIFGMQICGNKAEQLVQCAELFDLENLQIDFIDLNVGCPIDSVFNHGAGSALMESKNRLGRCLRGLDAVSSIPVTVKIRTGVFDSKPNAHTLIPALARWGIPHVTLHGRSRQQRYTRLADWDYIAQCSKARPSVLDVEGNAHPALSMFGNGDILSYEDYYRHTEGDGGVDGVMVGRGALIKPWIFTEIKERRHWDITSTERLEIMRQFCDYGLEHWGSDTQGVNLTRKFLCEWQSFLHRYIPIGLLEVMPPRINDRPPAYRGRDELETLMASPQASDWIKISELILGKAPETFEFVPKHKANAYNAGSDGILDPVAEG